MNFNWGFDDEEVDVKDSSSNDNELNKFMNSLINSKDLNIKTDEKLLKQFNEFISNKLYPIMMDDNIFNKEVQPELLKMLDIYSYAFLDLIKKPYLNNKKVIAVAGRFSSGKSSFLNAITDLKLPTDVEATTAIPTYITFYKTLYEGKFTQFQITGNKMLVNSIFGEKVMDTELLSFITKENTKNFPIPLSRLMNYFVISQKSDILKNKVILDTPGIDPSDRDGFDFDDKISSEAIVLANMVMWVIDVSDGDIVKHSLEYLQKNLKETQDLVVIVNKVDIKPPKEREKVIQKITKTITENIISKKLQCKSWKIFSFSKKDLSLKSQIKGFIRGLKVENTIPEVITLIEMMLEDARKVVVDRVFQIRENIKEKETFINDFISLNTPNMSTDEFKKAISKFLDKYPYLTTESKVIQEIIKINEKIRARWRGIDNKFKLDSPMFGDDKYYIYTYEWNSFTNLIFDYSNFHSEFAGWIWDIVGFNNNQLSILQNELEELEDTEEFINDAINQFEKIQYKLKQMI